MDENCCVVTCETPLNEAYWDAQYQANTTNWDLGQVAPPLQLYFDTITNKELRILIPGCGTTYEAEYLLEKGFSKLTVIDIAPTLIALLKTKFDNNQNITVIHGDFFEHQGEYDLIVEQTFFCAIPPNLRQRYVGKMHQLLAANGKLTGLLFNRTFEVSPPFGGSQSEYQALFSEAFHLHEMDSCVNSIPKRADSELFFSFEKNTLANVALYDFQGITCSSCSNRITEKLKAIEGVLNVSIGADFSEVLIVSTAEVPLNTLQEAIAYDAKYSIKEK